MSTHYLQWSQAACLSAAVLCFKWPQCNGQVMEELRLRLPGFAPARMLDFGAGPGTATWAAVAVRSEMHTSVN